MRKKQQETTPFTIDTNIYNPCDIDKILNETNIKWIKNNKKIETGNISIAFDIEVSSFYRLKENHNEITNVKPSDKVIKKYEKCACMYAWVFGINGHCIIGRTWEEFINILNKLSSHYGLSSSRKLLIYVHNLSYEFQFLSHRLNFESVFSLDERKPIKALTDIGIEFRCSYQLSGYSLKSVGDNLTKYLVIKKVGDLDYKKIRHSKTPLTDKELGYILNDGLVVMAYIQEKIESDGDITKLPLTKTGYVRKYCRKQTLYNGVSSHKKGGYQFNIYRRMMKSMNINKDEYKQLKRAFQGGFTHANPLSSGIVCEDVTSYDFTSSYPYCMVAFKYPMSSGEKVKIKSKEEFDKALKKYCCLFDIHFKNVQSIIPFEHPISSSKCVIRGNYQLDNGRIVYANDLKTTITELDYYIYSKYYKWDEMKIANFRIYKKSYLPTNFIKSILNLYQKKTTLKGLEDDNSKINYMNSKEQLNSCYGMCVTDICRDEIVFNSNDDNCDWSRESVDIGKALEKYNNSKQRFLSYTWGVWVTAYARFNLFTGIHELGEDYIYSDTDSVKFKNYEKHKEYFKIYNDKVIERLKKVMNFHKLDINLAIPKTIKGVDKPLGVWDFDGYYKKFKTLGAKRYMVLKDNKYSFTISGVSKITALPYLLDISKTENIDVFDLFTDDMYIPSQYTGKNTHTYIDDEMSGYIKDYQGNESTFNELSSIHMEECDFTLSLSDNYINYLKGIREIYKS